MSWSIDYRSPARTASCSRPLEWHFEVCCHYPNLKEDPIIALINSIFFLQPSLSLDHFSWKLILNSTGIRSWWTPKLLCLYQTVGARKALHSQAEIMTTQTAAVWLRPRDSAHFLPLFFACIILKLLSVPPSQILGCSAAVSGHTKINSFSALPPILSLLLGFFWGKVASSGNP